MKHSQRNNIIIGVSITILVFCFLCNTETFEQFYCPNCRRNNWMGESQCASCDNCGWCIDPNGYGSCGLGDANGPYFKDCRSWYHRGICMRGPDCGLRGPVYVTSYPWYNPWGWYGRMRGFRRRPHWRRYGRRHGGHHGGHHSGHHGAHAARGGRGGGRRGRGRRGRGGGRRGRGGGR